jgi:hypothetical protein
VGADVNVLIIGNGKGSWSMRGVQLGAALGARVTSSPTADDFGWSDVVVLVKRAGAVFATQARTADRPIVWDALDFWSQPGDHRLTESQAKALLHAQIRVIKPALVIGATEAMARACDGVFLPHHSWKGLVPTPARELVSVVGYEGNAAYLGKWAPAIQTECAARGWTFVINPPDLRLVDLFVAFRDDPWDGWMPREWKSGVKTVNAQAAGRPLIGQRSAALTEICAPHSVVESARQLSDRCDAWDAREWRNECVGLCRQGAPEYTLAAVADRYRQILQTVRQPCSV